MDFEGEADAEDVILIAPAAWYEDEDHTRDKGDDAWQVGVARVPAVLLQPVAAQLCGGTGLRHMSLATAWMLAIAEKFPNTSLRKLRSQDPSLLPTWILQELTDSCSGFKFLQDNLLVLRRGGIFASGSRARREPSSKSRSILAATLKCRFMEGFAAEGMLCNSPPIPLRVLDFLEHTEDLLNLAVVCKATHQAGHVLLHREFPRGLGPGLVTRYDLAEAIKRRKRGMLESLLCQPHHPITSSMASASTMAAGTDAEACAGPPSPQPLWKRRRTEAEACAGAGTEAEACASAETEADACAGVGTKPEACAGAGTDPQACSGAGMEPSTSTIAAGTASGTAAVFPGVADSVAAMGVEPASEIAVRVAAADLAEAMGMEPEACAGEDAKAEDPLQMEMWLLMEPDRWDVRDYFMIVLLHASKAAAADPSMVEPPHLSLDSLLRGSADEFQSGAGRWMAAGWMAAGIVLDAEAVRGAIALLAELSSSDDAFRTACAPDLRRLDGQDAARDAKHLMRLLRAAERHGQGVIVHPDVVRQ